MSDNGQNLPDDLRLFLCVTPTIVGSNIVSHKKSVFKSI